MAPSEVASLPELRGRAALVLGAARSGLALARMLARRGARVTLYDRRAANELPGTLEALAGLPVELALGVAPPAAERLLRDADAIFTSPSISPLFPTTDAWLREALVRAQTAGTPLLSEVDVFLRLTSARVLAVTGTKGKTTTAAMIGSILERAGLPSVVGGNIGRPLVEMAEELTSEHWAVLELSELQLPTISRGADIAVYTNVLADHLDRHGSVEAYRAVKARLAELARPGSQLVLNGDDPVASALSGRAEAGVTVHRYGLRATSPAGANGAWVGDGWVQLADGDAPARVLPVAELSLPGDHMLLNALAAALATRLAGAEVDAIGDALRTFRGVAHRLETVGTHDGVRYVNDSQATIPAAAIAALRAFDAPIVLIAGGRGKGLDYRQFADEVAARCRAAVLIGESAAELESLIGGRVPVERAEGMAAAVDRARRIARPGDVVLLSPAATSFDIFDDYEARGEAFRAAVAPTVEDGA